MNVLETGRPYVPFGCCWTLCHLARSESAWANGIHVFHSSHILACEYTKMLEKNVIGIYLFTFKFQMCRIRLIVCLGVTCSIPTIQSSLLPLLMLLLLPMVIIINIFRNILKFDISYWQDVVLTFGQLFWLMVSFFSYLLMSFLLFQYSLWLMRPPPTPTHYQEPRHKIAIRIAQDHLEA